MAGVLKGWDKMTTDITEQRIDKIISDLILIEMNDNITGSQFRIIDNTIDILFQLYDEYKILKRGK